MLAGLYISGVISRFAQVSSHISATVIVNNARAKVTCWKTITLNLPANGDVSWYPYTRLECLFACLIVFFFLPVRYRNHVGYWRRKEVLRYTDLMHSHGGDSDERRFPLQKENKKKHQTRTVAGARAGLGWRGAGLCAPRAEGRELGSTSLG